MHSITRKAEDPAKKNGQEPREPGQPGPQGKSCLKSHLERIPGLLLDRTPQPRKTEDATLSTATATGLSTLLSPPLETM